MILINPRPFADGNNLGLDIGSQSFYINNKSSFSVREVNIIVDYNFALEYAIRKVQETNLGLDMNGTHQVLAYADDVNVIGDDIRTIERNADVLLN